MIRKPLRQTTPEERRPLVLFQNLDVFTWALALVCRLRGKRVLVCDPPATVPGRFSLFIRKLLSIEQLNVANMRFEDGSRAMRVHAAFCKAAIHRLMGDDKALRRFRERIPGHVTEQALRIVAFDILNNVTNKLSWVLTFAEALRKTHGSVELALVLSPVQRAGLRHYEPAFRNIVPAFASDLTLLLQVAGRVTARAVSLCLKAVKARARGDHASAVAKETARKHDDSRRYEVVLFPHQGLLYGNLFVKDYYFWGDKADPLSRHNVLHIEYSDLPEETRKYYAENDIPNMRLERPQTQVLLKRIPGLVGPALRMAMGEGGPTGALLASLSVLLVHRYRWALRNLGGVRLALVGYDYLFPKALAVALQAQNVHVAAVQERFIQPFYACFSAIFDSYLVSGPRVARQLLCNPYCLVDHYHEVGCPRTELILRNSQSMPQKKDTVGKTVLVLDYHSESDQERHSPRLLTSWENNRAFYEDVIRLAERFPETMFVIRGKNTNWMTIDFFKPTLCTMSTLPNIVVNREYDRLNVSYELLAKTDVVLAKHTSLADEALAVGKSVIFHDYTRNCRKGISTIFDYDGLPLFVFSYAELENRLQDLLAGAPLMEDSALRSMRNTYYCAFAPESVRKRIADILHSILNTSRTKAIS